MGIHTQRTIVAGVLALRAGAVVGVAADTADIVIGHIPAPGGDGVPLLDYDPHVCYLRFAVCRRRVVRRVLATRKPREVS